MTQWVILRAAIMKNTHNDASAFEKRYSRALSFVDKYVSEDAGKNNRPPTLRLVVDYLIM